MMTPRFALLATLVLAAVPAATAQKAPCGFRAPTVSRVDAQPFQLKQVRTVQVGDAARNWYTGETVLTVTPATGAAYTLPVQVELVTSSVINAAGDGSTDGILTMRSATARQAIAGPLTAVNQGFGDLSGMVEARMCTRGAPPVSLRANFHGVFKADASGAYTLVDVTSHGVLLESPAGRSR